MNLVTAPSYSVLDAKSDIQARELVAKIYGVDPEAKLDVDSLEAQFRRLCCLLPRSIGIAVRHGQVPVVGYLGADVAAE